MIGIATPILLVMAATVSSALELFLFIDHTPLTLITCTLPSSPTDSLIKLEYHPPFCPHCPTLLVSPIESVVQCAALVPRLITAQGVALVIHCVALLPSHTGNCWY